MPCIITTIYVLTSSTMYRPRCSKMLSGLCSAFGTCWVVQCHSSIESNLRISTTEHVHALNFLSHIGCTVTINRVRKSPKRCHSIGCKRPCEYFSKSPRVFQTATVRNLLIWQQSSTYYYQVCASSNSNSCLKFHLEKKCWGIINLDNHYSIKPGTL